jgi:Fe(3+) dicitrate transport protein
VTLPPGRVLARQVAGDLEAAAERLPLLVASEEVPLAEQSINYEAGTRFVERKTHLELIGFFNDYSNLTDVCTFSSGCLSADLDRQFDAGRANIYGVEVLAGHDLELDSGAVTFPLSAVYTLSFGEFETGFLSADPIYGDVEAGDEVPYLPRHQLSVTVGLSVDWFEAYTVMNYVAATREQAGSEALSEVTSTDPLLTFDGGVSAQVREKIKLYLNGRNLGDYRAIVSHRPFGARPNAPRWIQGGVKVEW